MDWSDPFLRTGSPAGRTTIGLVQALNRLVRPIIHRSVFHKDLLVVYWFSVENPPSPNHILQQLHQYGY